MKVAEGVYQEGKVTLLGSVSEEGGTRVVVIFPEQKAAQVGPTRDVCDLFGAWESWWTDEVDAVVREAFRGRMNDAL